jgi:light-independent protochlorophyllide reductase subunit B
LMMGLEEHLLTMFREDSEFKADGAPSHLGGGAATIPSESEPILLAQELPAHAQGEFSTPSSAPTDIFAWTHDAEKELKKIPFFVRGKARRNTERFAVERGVATITIETLYDAKAHFSR